MTDSFAELWNSTAPTKPAEPPRPLGAITPAVSGQRKPQNDVFSLLAASSTPSSTRSSTPSYVAGQQGSKGISSKPITQPIKKASSTGADAFSDLFSGGSSGSNNVANMTIAERAVLVEKQRLERLAQPKQQVKPSDHSTHVWAGLDALGSSSSTSQVAFSSSASTPVVDDWDLGFDQPAKSAIVTNSHPPEDDWGLSDFVSQPAASKPSATKAQQAQSLWGDLDDFPSLSTHSSSRASPAPGKGGSTPGSFDFGDREDGLLDDHSDIEDDILGVLAKPVRSGSPLDGAERAAPSPQPPSSSKRAVSPPPHILGQIVEMGFSPQQARVALASTETGLDVQAALEILLANGAASSSRHASPTVEEPRRRERPRDTERGLRHSGDDSSPPRARLPPRRDRMREPPSREGPAAAVPPADADSDNQRNLQEQADKLLAQASEIGLSMFNRANALWNAGREKVQRAYEEHSAATAGKQPDRRDSRPRWMPESADHNEEHDGWGDHTGGGGFKDDHDGSEILPPLPDEQIQSRDKSAPRVARSTSRRTEATSPIVKTGSLLSDDAPAIYVSPFRRKVPPRSRAAPDAQPMHSTAPPPRTASPVALIQRQTISATSSALAASAKHKGTGTEMFKLGRYAEAETSYSYAIAALPDTHLLLVPLYNNRALTRIRIGDQSGAIEDCTAALKIIGPSFHPAREAKVTREDSGAGVDLGDAYVKALRRRAEASEGKERWDAARQDWEAVAGTEWAAGKARGEAAQAAARCRRMLTANPDAPSSAATAAVAAAFKPKPKPKTKPRPVQRVPTPPSEALNRVREANEAAEAEDLEKHALKDTVDARLIGWKGGKETNIRALIASLEMVLWPELGWQKVGMHELVTPAQVKIRYTKAIAKLHPDKLNVHNTTLEQRMIANGVFGSLNDAWNAFKQ